MKNPDSPWLTIALSDYEGHMALPQVAQAQLLADVFAEQLKIHKPLSVAVLRCAGGNGFERIDADVTRRVVGVDLNGSYLEQARRRFEAKFERLELVEGDIQTGTAAFAPVDLIYAALILEYVNVEATFARIRDWLNPAGTLATVVQLPGPNQPAVTSSAFASLAVLASVMHLVAPTRLRAIADGHRLHQVACATRQTRPGKRFEVQEFHVR